MKQDRLLLSDLEAVKFKDDLQQHIAGLNDKQKNCKPVVAYWWMPFDWVETLEKLSYKDEHLSFEEGNGFVDCKLLYCQKPA
jgi:hypothetical protein